MTESAANALLKAIEEPGTQTVWILCAPSVDEVLPTIRSRCRLLPLQTPTTKEITEYLESNLKINPETAKLSASAAQGHIGRAKYFATDAGALQVRSKVLKLFNSISSEHQAIQVAAELVEMATTRSEVRNQESDQKEEENLRMTIQGPSRGFLQGGSKALKELEKTQKNRNTRTIRDEIDSYLIYLQSFLRDAILYNRNSTHSLINADLTKELASIQAKSVPAKLEELALRINHYRLNLDSNASQLLTLESLTLDFLTTTRGR
jgi:DNA polymerase-3 subunit delta'